MKKITEELIDELKNKNTNTKYLVYPILYLDYDPYPAIKGVVSV